MDGWMDGRIGWIAGREGKKRSAESPEWHHQALCEVSQGLAGRQAELDPRCGTSTGTFCIAQLQSAGGRKYTQHANAGERVLARTLRECGMRDAGAGADARVRTPPPPFRCWGGQGARAPAGLPADEETKAQQGCRGHKVGRMLGGCMERGKELRRRKPEESGVVIHGWRAWDVASLGCATLR